MSFFMSVPYGQETVSQTSQLYCVLKRLIIQKDSDAIVVCYVGSVYVVDPRGR
jgi:hypothetical protein